MPNFSKNTHISPSSPLMSSPALTANNAFAQKRLQKEGIYCLHTKHINLCGGIDVVAFDKVGKLRRGKSENSSWWNCIENENTPSCDSPGDLLN